MTPPQDNVWTPKSSQPSLRPDIIRLVAYACPLSTAAGLRQMSRSCSHAVSVDDLATIFATRYVTQVVEDQNNWECPFVRAIDRLCSWKPDFIRPVDLPSLQHAVPLHPTAAALTTRMLIQSGFNIAEENHLAVRLAARHSNPAVMRELIQAGADLHALEHYRGDERGMAFAARGDRDYGRNYFYDIPDEPSNHLIDGAMTYDAMDTLVRCAAIGNVDTVRVCVESGMDLSKSGYLAYLVAVGANHISAARVLLSAVGGNVTNFEWPDWFAEYNHRETILEAVRSGHLEAVKFLLDQGIDGDFVGDADVLERAVRTKNVEMVERLLDGKAGIHALRDYFRRHPALENTDGSDRLSTLPTTCVDTISKYITTIKDFHSFLNTHPNIRSTARPRHYLALAEHAAKDKRLGLPVSGFVNCIPPCLLPAVDETPEEAHKGTRFFTDIVKLFVKSYPSATPPFYLYPVLEEYVRNNRVNAIDCVVELGIVHAKEVMEAAAKAGSLSSMKSFVEKYNILWEDVIDSRTLSEVWNREHEEMALYLLKKFPRYRERMRFRGLVQQNKLRWIKFLESHGYSVAATSLPELLKLAIEEGYEELAEYFLSHGASLTAPGVLQSAIRCRDVSMSTNLVRRAIDAGADVNQADMSGLPQDPLFQALSYDPDDLAEMLVEAGADLQALMGDAVHDIELWKDVGSFAGGGDGCRALRWLLRKGCKPRSEDVGQLLRCAEVFAGVGLPERVELWRRYQEGRDVTSAESTSRTG
ncbi:hypothetical protein HK104_002910 [Borealophlyctis nickersoniae]|nr:hypothetical protein HK104_002910 [Borealophlyctis nickersoniae]